MAAVTLIAARIRLPQQGCDCPCAAWPVRDGAGGRRRPDPGSCARPADVLRAGHGLGRDGTACTARRKPLIGTCPTCDMPMIAKGLFFTETLCTYSIKSLRREKAFVIMPVDLIWQFARRGECRACGAGLGRAAAANDLAGRHRSALLQALTAVAGNRARGGIARCRPLGDVSCGEEVRKPVPDDARGGSRC